MYPEGGIDETRPLTQNLAVRTVVVKVSKAYACQNMCVNMPLLWEKTGKHTKKQVVADNLLHAYALCGVTCSHPSENRASITTKRNGSSVSHLLRRWVE